MFEIRPRARSPPSKSLNSPKKINDLEVNMKTIRIKDYYGIYQEVPVDDAVYEEWLQLHREEDRLHKREVYHSAFTTPEDLEEGHRPDCFEDSVLESIIREEENMRLYEAISTLSPIQQRRVRMFMENMTYADIARAEGRKPPAVYRSLQKAFQHLRLLLSE